MDKTKIERDRGESRKQVLDPNTEEDVQQDQAPRETHMTVTAGDWDDLEAKLGSLEKDLDREKSKRRGLADDLEKVQSTTADNAASLHYIKKALAPVFSLLDDLS